MNFTSQAASERTKAIGLAGEALALVFSRGELEVFLRTKLGLELTDLIQPNTTDPELTGLVARALHRRGQLVELLEKAAAERPLHKEFQAACAEARCRVELCAKQHQLTSASFHASRNVARQRSSGRTPNRAGDLEPGQQRALLDFLITAFDNARLITCLRQLGRDHTDLESWKADASQRLNFRRLIAEAAQDEWGRLLAFATLAVKSAGVRKPRSLLSEHERAGISLLSLLRGLATQVVAECYHLTRPVHARAYDGPLTRMVIAYLVLTAEEAAPARQPLLKFLEALADRSGPPIRQRLSAWWVQMRSRLGLRGELRDLGVLCPPSQPQTYAVLVELRDTNHSTPALPCWHCRTWLYSDAACRLDPLEGQTRTETLATITTYLTRLREQLARRRLSLEQMRFEFFVSPRHFCRSFDQLPVLLEGIEVELGYQNPVVIRALRGAESCLNLEKRWARLRAKQSLLLDVEVLPTSTGGDPRVLYRQFEAVPDLQGLLLTVPFRGHDDLSQLACIPAALAAGIPILLWGRHETAPAQLTNTVKHWLAQPPCQLPQLVYALRKSCPEGSAEHLGRHVTLFFENANYWLPADDPLSEVK